jgi:hypothetical protein
VVRCPPGELEQKVWQFTILPDAPESTTTNMVLNELNDTGKDRIIRWICGDSHLVSYPGAGATSFYCACGPQKKKHAPYDKQTPMWELLSSHQVARSGMTRIGVCLLIPSEIRAASECEHGGILLRPSAVERSGEFFDSYDCMVILLHIRGH